MQRAGVDVVVGVHAHRLQGEGDAAAAASERFDALRGCAGPEAIAPPATEPAAEAGGGPSGMRQDGGTT